MESITMNCRHRWFRYYVLSLLPPPPLRIDIPLGSGQIILFISTARSLDLLSYAHLQLICRDPAGVIGHIPLQSVRHSVILILHTERGKGEKSTCDVSTLMYVAFIPQVYYFTSPEFLSVSWLYSRVHCLVLPMEPWPRKKGFI